MIDYSTLHSDFYFLNFINYNMHIMLHILENRDVIYVHLKCVVHLLHLCSSSKESMHTFANIHIVAGRESIKTGQRGIFCTYGYP